MNISDLQKKVYEAYCCAFKLKFKKEPKQSDQNTVLAAFVLYERKQGEFHVASMATGTKSLPIELLQQHDRKVLRDMHAEVLARRAFLSLLRDCVYQLQGQPHKNGFLPELFTLDKKRNKLCLNTCRYQLVLYTTELPCGSCTIDINSNLFSGAKPLSAFASIDYEHNQEIIFDKNVLRTKPGRLDLPLNKRSCSLSCSDKIMMWALMGIQGKKLFRYYLPIYIDTIVVETEEKAALQNLKEALSIKHRLGKILHKKPETIERRLFNVVINGKERPFTKQFTCRVPQVVKLPKSFNPKTQEQGLKKTDSSLIIDYKGNVEECNGHTGIKHGCSVKHLAKGISQYSSEKLVDSIEGSPLYYQYEALKERVKTLFGVWTTVHKPWRNTTTMQALNQGKIETVTEPPPSVIQGSFQS